MELQALAGLGGTAVVVALSNAVIRPYISDTRFIPLLTILLGIGWNVGLAAAGVGGGTTTFATAVIVGILTGLAATNEFPGSLLASPAVVQSPIIRQIEAAQTPSIDKGTRATEEVTV